MELWSQRAKRAFILRFSYYIDLKRYNTIRMARDIHQPVFIIHGMQDKNVSSIESRRLYRALNEPKRLLVIPGARHNFNELVHQRTVVSAVKQWLGEYLAKRTSRVVNVYIRHQGRYLIVKRSNDVGYYRGRWAVVSGHAVSGVSVIDQAYHEAAEEAGLRRSQLKLVRIGKTVRREDPGIGKTWLITPVLMESSTARVKLDWEHTACRWIKLKDFPVTRSYPGIAQQFKILKLE